METQERNGSFFRFEDLRIYSKAIDYSVWLSTSISEPKSEKERNLVTAFFRSAYDISLNIAEGSARSKNQFEHYLKISKTAIRECIAFTEMAYKLNMLSQESYENSREFLMEMTRMIGALITSLQRGSGRRHDDEDDRDEVAADVDVNESVDPLDSIETNF